MSYDSRYEEAAEAQYEAEMIEKWGPNWAGLIDTESDDPFYAEWGTLSNHPDTGAMLFDSVLHTMGLIDTNHCYTCYLNMSAEEHDRDDS